VNEAALEVTVLTAVGKRVEGGRRTEAMCDDINQRSVEKTTMIESSPDDQNDKGAELNRTVLEPGGGKEKSINGNAQSQSRWGCRPGRCREMQL
jgi:hypothetical protein